MNIVLIGSLAVDSSDVTLLVRKALQAEGHVVELLPTDEGYSAHEVALARAGRFDSHAFRRAFSRRVRDAVRKLRADVLILFGSNSTILPDTLARLRQEINVTILLWEFNLRFWRGYQAESLRHYDHVFIGDSYPIPLLTGAGGVRNVHFLGPGCDPDVHRPLQLSPQEQQTFGADVCYVGTAHPNRVRMFEALTDFGIRLWGEKWRRSPTLAPFSLPGTVYGMRKTKIYNAAKIMLNLQSVETQVNGISCRPFEVLACGSFCLTEYKPDLERFFKVGEEIVAFHDLEDLRAKIDHYLTHDDERQAIADRGRKKVLANYTYRQIMCHMLSTVAISGPDVAGR